VVDEEVVARFRSGDPDAVRAVYQAYGRMVFGVAFKVLGDQALAEEATQEAFVRAWKAARSFDPARNLAPWLSTIVRRIAIDLYRRESRREHDSLDALAERAGTGMSVDRAVDIWDVRQAVAGLPSDEQTVVSLQHGMGLTHVEIAARLGVPVGTVKSRSFRAHRHLAAALGQPDAEAPRTVGPAAT
jgi:RNA polymerase sigma-70 factor (ECF subfamily)